MEREYPDLWQFLGGWFNQDWPLDHDSPGDVLRYAVAKEPPTLVSTVIAEIERFLRENGEVTQQELHQLGADIVPESFGWTPTEFVEWVREELIRLSESPTS